MLMTDIRDKTIFYGTQNFKILDLLILIFNHLNISLDAKTDAHVFLEQT
jgi:hypothetical protein